MSRVSMTELSEHIGCKPNQRCTMIRWLKKNHWIYHIDTKGLPSVQKAYFDRMTGNTEGKQSLRYADSPNLQAFA